MDNSANIESETTQYTQLYKGSTDGPTQTLNGSFNEDKVLDGSVTTEVDSTDERKLSAADKLTAGLTITNDEEKITKEDISTQNVLQSEESPKKNEIKDETGEVSEDETGEVSEDKTGEVSDKESNLNGLTEVVSKDNMEKNQITMGLDKPVLEDASNVAILNTDEMSNQSHVAEAVSSPDTNNTDDHKEIEADAVTEIGDAEVSEETKVVQADATSEISNTDCI